MSYYQNYASYANNGYSYGEGGYSYSPSDTSSYYSYGGSGSSYYNYAGANSDYNYSGDDSGNSYNPAYDGSAQANYGQGKGGGSSGGGLPGGGASGGSQQSSPGTQQQRQQPQVQRVVYRQAPNTGARLTPLVTGAGVNRQSLQNPNAAYNSDYTNYTNPINYSGTNWGPVMLIGGAGLIAYFAFK